MMGQKRTLWRRHRSFRFIEYISLVQPAAYRGQILYFAELDPQCIVWVGIKWPSADGNPTVDCIHLNGILKQSENASIIRCEMSRRELSLLGRKEEILKILDPATVFELYRTYSRAMLLHFKDCGLHLRSSSSWNKETGSSCCEVCRHVQLNSQTMSFWF